MSSEGIFHDVLSEHIEVARRSATLSDAADVFSRMVVGCLRAGNKVLFCGNGGSAADSQHLATEMTVRFETNRVALAAIALSTDTSALTAAANDFGIESMFARQVEALGREGDVLVGITTSGNSANVLAAFSAARARKIKTVALTGEGGGRIGEQADLCLAVPSRVTARVQEMHILIGHALCRAVDRAFS